MNQIVDKLNKIAKAIDENVELSDRDLIIDSLDSITKAFGGTPNKSNLIVDKLDDIASVVSKGGGGSETKKVVIISEQTVQGELMGEQQEGEQLYGTYVSVENPLTSYPDTLNVVLDGTEYIATKLGEAAYLVGEGEENFLIALVFSPDGNACQLMFLNGDEHTIEAYIMEQPSDSSKYVIISEQTVQGEQQEGEAAYRAEVSLENELTSYPDTLNVVLDGTEYIANKHPESSDYFPMYIVGEGEENFLVGIMFDSHDPTLCRLIFLDGDQHTIEVYIMEQPSDDNGFMIAAERQEFKEGEK